MSAARGLLGAPATCLLERRVEGAFPVAEYGRLVELIGRRTRRQGRRSVREGALEWRNESDVEGLQVSVGPDGGGTRVRVLAQYGTMAGFVFFVAIFSGLVLTAAAGGFFIGPETLASMLAIAVVGLVASFVVGRALWTQFALRRRGELERLLEELAAEIGRVNQQAG